MRDALRLGTHQLLSMRVPDHAAISTSVDLVRARSARARPAWSTPSSAGSPSTTSPVGRRVAPDPASDPVGFASRGAQPPALGRGGAGPGRRRATSSTRCSPPTTSPHAWSWSPAPASPPSTSCPGTPHPLSPYGVVLAGGDPGAVPAVAEGRAGRPGRGLAAGRARAGPGAGRRPRRALARPLRRPGRQGRPAGRARSRRAAACWRHERQPHRARLVAARARRRRRASLGVVAGRRHPPRRGRPAAFDRVLVDAPCSGLGALRRRPESRWRRSPDDLATWCRSSGRCSTRRWTASGPAEWSSTRPARPLLAETAGVVDRRPRVARTTSCWRTRGSAAAGGPIRRRPDSEHPATLAP